MFIERIGKRLHTDTNVYCQKYAHIDRIQCYMKSFLLIFRKLMKI